MFLFFLPEYDDPGKAGRLVVQGTDGREVVLDKVLAAAQLNDDGTENEPVEIFPEDLDASAGLSGAVRRADDVSPPERFRIHYDTGAIRPAPDDPDVAALIGALNARGAKDPIRIALSGHADCIGGRAANRRLSRQRVEALFRDVAAPVLLERGFTERHLRRSDRVKIVGVGAFSKAAFGETAPLRAPGPRCIADVAERRVDVALQ